MADLQQQRLERLAATLGGQTGAVERLVDEINALYDRTLAEFVQKRHAEYRRTTRLRNDEIYRRIQREVEDWRFRSPALSLRQIRRMIYG